MEMAYRHLNSVGAVFSNLSRLNILSASAIPRTRHIILQNNQLAHSYRPKYSLTTSQYHKELLHIPMPVHTRLIPILRPGLYLHRFLLRRSQSSLLELWNSDQAR